MQWPGCRRRGSRSHAPIGIRVSRHATPLHAFDVLSSHTLTKGMVSVQNRFFWPFLLFLCLCVVFPQLATATGAVSHTSPAGVSFKIPEGWKEVPLEDIFLPEDIQILDAAFYTSFYYEKNFDSFIGFSTLDLWEASSPEERKGLTESEFRSQPIPPDELAKIFGLKSSQFTLFSHYSDTYLALSDADILKFLSVDDVLQIQSAFLLARNGILYIYIYMDVSYNINRLYDMYRLLRTAVYTPPSQYPSSTIPLDVFLPLATPSPPVATSTSDASYRPYATLSPASVFSPGYTSPASVSFDLNTGGVFYTSPSGVSFRSPDGWKEIPFKEVLLPEEMQLLDSTLGAAFYYEKNRESIFILSTLDLWKSLSNEYRNGLSESEYRNQNLSSNELAKIIGLNPTQFTLLSHNTDIYVVVSAPDTMNLIPIDDVAQAQKAFFLVRNGILYSYAYIDTSENADRVDDIYSFLRSAVYTAPSQYPSATLPPDTWHRPITSSLFLHDTNFITFFLGLVLRRDADLRFSFYSLPFFFSLIRIVFFCFALPTFLSYLLYKKRPARRRRIGSIIVIIQLIFHLPTYFFLYMAGRSMGISTMAVIAISLYTYALLSLKLGATKEPTAPYRSPGSFVIVDDKSTVLPTDLPPAAPEPPAPLELPESTEPPEPPAPSQDPPDPLPDHSIYCKHCGRVIDGDSVFCRFCGGSQSSPSSDSPTRQRRADRRE